MENKLNLNLDTKWYLLYLINVFRAYYNQYGVKYTSIIPTNIFGPNDNYNLVDSHVIPGLIHKCYISKSNFI